MNMISKINIGKILKIAIVLLSVVSLFGIASAAAPVADFTANATLIPPGTPVGFTDSSTNTPTGWNWTFGDENWTNQTWVLQNSSGGWTPRNLQSVVRLQDGSIVMAGGANVSTLTVYSDVWRSTDNGSTWTLMNASTGWGKRFGASSVVLQNGDMAVFNGYNGTAAGVFNDTWKTTDGGNVWTLVNISAGYPARYYSSSVLLPDNSIVITGGYSGSANFNDTWRSTDGGNSWVQMNTSGGWEARYQHTTVVLKDGSIVLLGGLKSYATLRYNDTWRSTDNGATWTRINASSGWAARYMHSTVVMPDNTIIVMGGLTTLTNRVNDTWKSTDGGVTWINVTGNGPAWQPRSGQSAVLSLNNSIILMAGQASNTLAFNDTWMSIMPKVSSSEQNPTHVYSIPGKYSVLLTSTNDDGSNITLKLYYINSGLPAINFSSNITVYNIYPLIARFNDTSIGNVTAWNWSFGDGRWFNTTNISLRCTTYTYNVAGKYDVTLITSNAVGNISLTKVNYINLTSDSDSNLTSWMHMNGTNGSTTFTDERGIAWTPNGNSQITDITYEFGNGSGWFDGNGDYLSTPNSTAFNFGTANFTIEFWVNVNSIAGTNDHIISKTNNPRTRGWGLDCSGGNDSGWDFYMGNDSAGQMFFNATIPNKTWTHIAVERISGTLYVYVNGNLTASKAGYGISYDTADPLWIARQSTNYADIKMDEFRISKRARWYANFTPPYNEYRGVLETNYPDINPNSTMRYKTNPGGNASISNTSTRNRTIQIENVFNTSYVIGVATFDPEHFYVKSVRLNESYFTTGMSLISSNMNNITGEISFNVSRPAGFNAGTTRASIIDYELIYYNYSEPSSPQDFFGSGYLLNGTTFQLYPIHNFISTNVTLLDWDLTTNFTAQNLNPITGTPVNFVDDSYRYGSYPNMWNWTFGDGESNNGTNQTVSHAYSTPGLKTVSLTISIWQNTSIVNQLTKTSYINVSEKLVSNFTSNITSGGYPLTVSFSDTSNDTPTEWAWFFGDEPYNQTWVRQNASNGWITQQRLLYSSVALPDGSLVFMGGYNQSAPVVAFNDTWRSTDNGVTWTLINASSGWSARGGQATTVTSNGTIILTGGGRANDLGISNDVWASTDKGYTWTQVNASAAFSIRYNHRMVTLPDDSIVLMLGYGSFAFRQDVWRSTDGGKIWIQQNPNTALGRYFFGATTTSNGSILINGGSGAATYQNDTWMSVDKGVTWTQLPNAPWQPNVATAVVTMPDGSILSMGGYQQFGFTTINTTWRSVNNGETWTQLPNAKWDARKNLLANVMPDGSVIVIAGTAGSVTFFNDTWRLQPVGSSIQNPIHVYALPGKYNVSLQIANDREYNNTQKVEYINVLDVTLPLANFTSNLTIGYTPLAILFNDTSTNATSWNWSFNNVTGNNTEIWFSTDQNATYIFGIGNYSIKLNASNVNGYNITPGLYFINVSDVGLPPVANFTSNLTMGTLFAPLPIQFTDTSSGVATSWNWSFNNVTGNNTEIIFSSLQNPIQTFNVGNFSIRLNASSIAGYNITPGLYFINVSQKPLAPIANFTANITFGIAPLPVLFNDTSLNDPTMWSWSFGDETYNQSWVLQSASNGWQPYSRTLYNSAVLPDGSIVFTGGRNKNAPDTFYNDTWRSTDKGVTWTLINASSGWSARGGETLVSLQDGTLLLTGGIISDEVQVNDVWISTDKGYTWTRINASAGWTPRQGAGCLVLPDGSVLLTSGYGSYSMKDDVWRSTDNGLTWTQTNSTAGIAALYTGNVVTDDGYVLVMGGFNGGSAENTVHISKDKGYTWETLNINPSWSPRYGMLASKFPGGNILMFGGYQQAGFSYMNDTWISKDGGLTWTQIILNNKWGVRSQQLGGVMPDGSIVMLVGQSASIFYNDTWRMQPSGSSLQNVTHIYTAPGKYNVSLTASNGGGFNTTTKIYYIEIGVLPIPDFTANATTAIQNEPIEFTNISTNSNITAWNWSFGNGNYSELMKPIYSYQDPGNYTVTLNVTNRSGYNSTTRTDYIKITQRVLPVANFTANTTSGIQDLTVQFNSTNTTFITTYNWTFGDGNFSAIQNPLFVYRVPGSYNVILNVTNNSGYGELTKYYYINVTARILPIPNFTANITSGLQGLPVQFTDDSITGITTWNWTFGDGNTSTVQNPLFIYNVIGTFNVKLNITNNSGYNETTYTNYITISERILPDSDFSANITSGIEDLTVEFTNTSTNSDITSWNWSFGNGNYSTDMKPIYVYQDAGTYTVILNATNSSGYSSTTKSNYITVTARVLPLSDFSANITSGFKDLVVEFTNTSINSDITSWNWSFGDGNYSTTMTPIYMYENVGTYTVTLNVTNISGYNSTTKVNYITINPSISPVADFVSNTTYGEAPLTVMFMDMSTGFPTSWAWDVQNDGTNESYTQNYVYTYTTPGLYSVKLTVSNPNGSDFLVKPNYIDVIAPIPPLSVTNLTPIEINCTAINFVWVNPPDADFLFAQVWLNNNYIINTSLQQYVATGLTGCTSYTLSIRTIDNRGNMNMTWVNATHITSACPPPAPTLTADFSIAQGNVCIPSNVILTSTSYSFFGISNYYWNITNGGNKVDFTTAIVNVNYIDAGSYTINLTVKDNTGNTSTKFKNLNTVNCSSPTPTPTPTREPGNVSQPQTSTQTAGNYTDIRIWAIMLIGCLATMVLSRDTTFRTIRPAIFGMISFILGISTLWFSLSIAYMGDFGVGAIVEYTNQTSQQIYYYQVIQVVASPVISMICLVILIFVILNMIDIGMNYIQRGDILEAETRDRNKERFGDKIRSVGGEIRKPERSARRETRGRIKK